MPYLLGELPWPAAAVAVANAEAGDIVQREFSPEVTAKTQLKQTFGQKSEQSNVYLEAIELPPPCRYRRCRGVEGERQGDRSPGSLLTDDSGINLSSDTDSRTAVNHHRTGHINSFHSIITLHEHRLYLLFISYTGVHKVKEQIFHKAKEAKEKRKVDGISLVLKYCMYFSNYAAFKKSPQYQVM